ncbi:MAG: hypothetical protein K940chlam3_00800 [Chlamydiae bacterium]|nr:hypothetical protein [Chlamydiota bacterium]
MSCVSPAWNTNQLIFFPREEEKNGPCYQLSRILNRGKAKFYLIINEPATFPTTLFDGYKRRMTSCGRKAEMEETANNINDALNEGYLIFAFVNLVERYDNYEISPWEMRRRFKISFAKSFNPTDVPTGIKFQGFKEDLAQSLPFGERSLPKLGSIKFEVKNWREDPIPLSLMPDVPV